MAHSPRYSAYLSYSHADEAAALRLHRRIETYRVPRHLVRQGKPSRIEHVFRDRAELPSSPNLGSELTLALKRSDALIVVCSPSAAASRWVNEEITEFKKQGGERAILPIIVAGEPPDCFPPALRYQYEITGELSRDVEEPVAADGRPGKDGVRDAGLKVIAGLLDVRFDDLKQRELHRQHQRMGTLAGVSIGIALVMTVLLVMTLASRSDAERRRTQAEGLVSFMIGDLRKQLEPLGRLDLLDAIGNQAMEFYGSLEPQDLTDELLATRARTLRQIGEVRATQGQFDDASFAFSQSLGLAEQLSDRYPDNRDLLFEVGQAHYWIGYVEFQHRQLGLAAESFGAYDVVAQALLRQEPGNADYQLEVMYAQSNLGTLALALNNLTDSAAYFEKAVLMNEALLTSEPDDAQLLHELAEGLSWLGAVAARSLQPHQAISWYYRELEIRQRLARDRTNRKFANALHNTQQLLSMQHYLVGDFEQAQTLANASLRGAEGLIQHDPSNTQWIRLGNVAAQIHGLILLGNDNIAAVALIERATTGSEVLWRRDVNNAQWLGDYLKSVRLLARARLLVGDSQGAIDAARTGLELIAESTLSSELVLFETIGGDLHLVLGDAFWARGELESARDAWKEALTLIVTAADDAMDPVAQGARIVALARNDRLGEAQRLHQALTASGYQFVNTLAWNELLQ